MTTASEHARITTTILTANVPGLEVALGLNETLAARVTALRVTLGLEETLWAIIGGTAASGHVSITTILAEDVPALGAELSLKECHGA